METPYQPPTIPGQPNSDDRASQATSSDLAAEVIRQKITALYGKEPAPVREAKEPDAVLEEQEAEQTGQHSKHQKYMYQLSHSGKSLEEIQTAWHAYYVALPDNQKHQVWQEFYSEHAKAKQAAAQKPAATKSTAKTTARRTTEQVKSQLLKHVSNRSKLQAKHHFQSILFGLGIGSVAILILLFGFFNERVIAPFITPSRTVSNTPIISDGSQPIGDATKVIIPKINVEIPVIYTQTSVDESAIQSSLQDGVVHYATTASPGEQGNTVIFGHSSNNILNKGKYKFAFVLLNRLQIGDTFTLTKNGKRYVYQIYQRKIVSPSDVSVLGPADKPATATLITCDPPGTSLNRLIVIGEQISPNPSGNTASTALKTDQAPAVVPSDAPSLWQHIKSWFSR